jgi:hypothetical protein
MLIPRQRANLYNGRGGEWAIRGTGLLRQIRNGNLPITAMRDVKFCYLQSIRNYSQSFAIFSPSETTASRLLSSVHQKLQPVDRD